MSHIKSPPVHLICVVLLLLALNMAWGLLQVAPIHKTHRQRPLHMLPFNELKHQQQHHQHTRSKLMLASTASVASESSSSSSSSSGQHQVGASAKGLPTGDRRHRPNKNEDSASYSSSRLGIRKMFTKAKSLERKGQWRKATHLLEAILRRDECDSHAYLGLAKLEARRGNLAQATDWFQRGTTACPTSIHLWQAWAVHQEKVAATGATSSLMRRRIRDDDDNTQSHHRPLQQQPSPRELYERALELEPHNPYVCHAYGLYEQRQGHDERAQDLWQRALPQNATAAIVCSLGQAWTRQGHVDRARTLYATYVDKLPTHRQRSEVYVAHAWLEERHARNPQRAQELLQTALQCDPRSSLCQVALARLEGRLYAATATTKKKIHSKTSLIRTKSSSASSSSSQSTVTLQRLARAASATKDNNPPNQQQPNHDRQQQQQQQQERSYYKDGRVYNAWASMEVKAKRYHSARRILREGLARHSRDYRLWQAAGKVEQLLHNVTGARALYCESLLIQPSAPTLVAYALLELQHPEQEDEGNSNEMVKANFTMAARLFEEALLLDPRHGPAYNSYGNAALKHGRNITLARTIFQRGVRANCSDAASVYHGYARLELSCGDIERARYLLRQGLAATAVHDYGMGDSPHLERAQFLTHSLGMLELDSNDATEALRIFQQGLNRFGNSSLSSSSQVLTGAALAEIQLGNVDQARQYLEQAVSVNPRHSQAWHAWAALEMRQGQLATAQTLLEAGLQANFRYGALWLALATVHSRRGRVDTAREVFLRGVQRARPTHLPLLEAWSSLELRVGNNSAARTLIARALTRDKRHASAWLVAAEIERSEGNLGLVHLLLRRGIECCSSKEQLDNRRMVGRHPSVELYRSLGSVLVGQGKINQARDVYERGLQLDPYYAPLYHSMAELEAQVFNVEGLARLNERAAAFFPAGLKRNSDQPQQQRNSDNAFSTKKSSWGIKEANRGDETGVSEQVIAFMAQRIVEEDEDVETSDSTSGGEVVDPDDFLRTISENLILKQEEQQQQRTEGTRIWEDLLLGNEDDRSWRSDK